MPILCSYVFIISLWSFQANTSSINWTRPKAISVKFYITIAMLKLSIWLKIKQSNNKNRNCIFRGCSQICTAASELFSPRCAAICCSIDLLWIKFIYSEKATKFEKIFLLFWRLLSKSANLSKKEEDFLKFLWPFQKSWTLQKNTQ